MDMTIVGIGIIVWVLFRSISWIDEEHNHHLLFQLLLIFMILSISLLVPKVLIENKNCELVLMNETVSDNTTINSYDYICPTGNSENILYYLYIWILRLMVIYIFLYINYEIWLRNLFQKYGITKPKQTKIKVGRKI